MSQAKKKKGAASARSRGSAASGRPAAPPRDATPPGTVPQDTPTARDSRPTEPGGENIPAALARRSGNGGTRRPATATATVPSLTTQPPITNLPPVTRPVTAIPAAINTADAKPATAKPTTAKTATAQAPTAKTADVKGVDPKAARGTGSSGKAASGTAARAAGASAAGASAAGARAAGASAAAVHAGDADEDVPRWAAKSLEQLLHATYWLDPGQEGDSFMATVRFTGQRTDISGRAGAGDTFTREETYNGIVPGSGPVAVTAEVRDINPGTWAVTARTVTLATTAGTAAPSRPAPTGRVPWPRRVTVPAGPNATVRTSTMLRSKVPGVIRYAYACLVVLGVLAGLGIAGALLGTAHYPVLEPELLSVAAVAAGVIGGKAWYAAVTHGKWDGWCIQGFVGGAAVVVAVVAVVGPGLPKGAFLAAATPALLIGMGIGRHACFWAGCCCGRPTASRWGIWSSDRRLGCRRMPVQLLEAWTALAVGAASLGVVLALGLARSGPVAVVALAAYTLVRQAILGLRDEPRHWRYGRALTASLAGLALIAGVVLLAVS
jgi:phosphatidylglycerol---prolipoprotein diacylglyceryl transferase